MIDDTMLDAEEKMERAVAHYRDDLATIRAGRATPQMFAGVSAEYYGSMTPITQMASISIPEARMVIIKPHDPSQMSNIENAIRNSDLGVNPTNDGHILRVTIPQLTEERRKDLSKRARSKGEEGKVAIRGVRRKAMDELKRLDKDGEAGEDEIKAAEKDLDKLTQKYVAEVDALVSSKQDELMEI